ncbi:hypothetical protein P691DRAFT_812096 [Macrolepiota fuliginosa MF-IS2]|uniref:Uncharacterized protein n=1 Tax=Macrolepiota fuliginosa MF-IS2 TaxID=1400762 RepID=A0A9P5XEM9_9AGAR|nr:hypothetical protein P691DRAFT_812096 [Macrolepiota fuliginosa MF-IS2]
MSVRSPFSWKPCTSREQKNFASKSAILKKLHSSGSGAAPQGPPPVATTTKRGNVADKMSSKSLQGDWTF